MLPQLLSHAPYYFLYDNVKENGMYLKTFRINRENVT